TESKKRLPWKHQRLRLEEGGELKEVWFFLRKNILLFHDGICTSKKYRCPQNADKDEYLDTSKPSAFE
ncbi:unnamed protein product, partial [Gulo gulo]